MVLLLATSHVSPLAYNLHWTQDLERKKIPSVSLGPQATEKDSHGKRQLWELMADTSTVFTEVLIVTTQD